jgi:basic amino acid/polyamine antiporter, APA family
MTDQGLMTRKSVAAIIKEAGEHTLGKTLGPLSITALGIGCIIGAGIFVLTGTAAAHYAGPGIMLSFVVGGIACTFVGLCYAELAALLPVSGSTYTYTYATLARSHRLGPHPRICHGRLHCRRRLVGLYCLAVA